jgi:hypothetical protein
VSTHSTRSVYPTPGTKPVTVNTPSGLGGKAAMAAPASSVTSADTVAGTPGAAGVTATTKWAVVAGVAPNAGGAWRRARDGARLHSSTAAAVARPTQGIINMSIPGMIDHAPHAKLPSMAGVARHEGPEYVWQTEQHPCRATRTRNLNVSYRKDLCPTLHISWCTCCGPHWTGVPHLRNDAPSQVHGGWVGAQCTVPAAQAQTAQQQPAV